MQNYGQGVFPFNIDSFYQPQPYQELLGVAASLQGIVLKQQTIIDSLALKQQQLEEQFQNISTKQENNTWIIKLEPNEDSYDREDSIPKTPAAPDNRNPVENMSNIRRRNGFKPLKKAKKDKKHHWDSENESLSGSKRRNPSKAKHLWVNYGRKIVEYGISQTEGVAQERVRQLMGKLNSKKDLKEVFQIKSNDSVEDQEFKKWMRNMAIDFVKNKATVSFEGAKHKQQMIDQRHVVAAWIERLVYCDSK